VDFRQPDAAAYPLQVPVFLRGTDVSGVEFIELTKTLNISSTGRLHYLNAYSSA